MKVQTKKPDHGGARQGAGRPKGVRNKRTQALADTLLKNDECPAEALIRLAKAAECEGKISLAIDAWKAVLPYVHAKPKAVETAPDIVAALARDIAEARIIANSVRDNTSYGDRLRKATADLELAH